MATWRVQGRDYRPRVGQKSGPLYGGIEQPGEGGGPIDGLMAAGPEVEHDVAGAFPFAGPLAALPSASAGKLAQGIALDSANRQKDFANQYMGSQIAPMWTSTLEGLHQAKAVKGEPGPTMAPSGATLSVLNNPAGMTQSGTEQAARDFVKGQPLPDWYEGAQPDTQESFQNRIRQAMAGLRRAQ